MAEQIGIVTRTEREGWARVAIKRSAGCSGCLVNPPTQGCRSCGNGPTMESRVANPIGAGTGDLVRVHLSSVAFLKGAALVYLLPIVLMLIGALALGWAGASIGWAGNAGAVGGGLIGLAVGVTFSMGLDRTGRIGRDRMPAIRQVVIPCNEMGARLRNPLCELGGSAILHE